MRGKKFRILAAVVIGLMVSLLACFSAYADWDDGEAYWQYNWNGGNVFAKWSKCQGAKGYLITLYKVSDSGSKSIVMGPAEATGTSKDVTQTIIKKGAGSYLFEITAYSKQQQNVYDVIGELGSDTIDLDATEITRIKEGRANQTNQTAVTDGWHQYPNNTWTYGKGNNTLAKNEWLNIDGKFYRFDNKGYMLKGWQQINGNYYYLDPTNGYLWVNCQTPDGYYVNADGARVNQSGTPLTGTAVNASVTITLEETGADGKTRNCTVKSVSGANLVEWHFEYPHENWQVGTPVRLYVTVSSTNNFPFNKNSKFSCSQASVKGFSGSDPAVVELLYYPKLKLTAPTNITMNDANVVSWHGSEYAQSYIVKLYNAGDLSSTNGTITLNPTSTHLDIGDYLDGSTDLIIGITSIHASSAGHTQARKYYLDSDETKNYDLHEVNSGAKLTDSTFSGSTAKLSYQDVDGVKAKGWQQLQGSWYYFDENGYAKGPGWYQDKDGNWYYFNNQYQMVIGKVTDNGKEYYMNDGSNPNFPYGAWVH